MSAGDRISDRHDCGGDAAAYVLGALEPAEAEAFRAHLATCIICRDEVAALQPVVDALPMAARQYDAPGGLRRRVLAAADAERPAPTPASPQRRRMTGFRLPRPALAGALAVVLAFAIVGVVHLASGGSSGVRVIPARVTALDASAQLRVTDGRAELVVRHFPPPPAGHIYEVWLQRGTAAPSPTKTLFSVTSSGAGNIGLPENMSGVSAVLVTPEPAGGSPAPTHSPVIVAPLT
jgi:anti-sigma-K factor RskA